MKRLGIGLPGLLAYTCLSTAYAVLGDSIHSTLDRRGVRAHRYDDRHH